MAVLLVLTPTATTSPLAECGHSVEADSTWSVDKAPAVTVPLLGEATSYGPNVVGRNCRDSGESAAEVIRERVYCWRNAPARAIPVLD